jgi:hypothetical protein
LDLIHISLTESIPTRIGELIGLAGLDHTKCFSSSIPHVLDNLAAPEDQKLGRTSSKLTSLTEL